ncbi:TetR/AcrR family transcriptional regulator C-terminal domain-containing protein [Streptomyces massasporeus]
MSTSFAALQSVLAEVSLRDSHRLGRRLEGARRIRKPEARAAVLDEIAVEAAKAKERVDGRASRVPAVTYPEQLPVSQKKDEILEAIRDHQVVIVAGETGSGKTTQIPKICLELGRGVRGMIGHTQPRRIAARTVAERVAEELRTPLGLRADTEGRALRTLVATEVHRFPELGRAWRAHGPAGHHPAVTNALRTLADRGLLDIPDLEVAVLQLYSLLVFPQMVFEQHGTELGEELGERLVVDGVEMFLLRYAPASRPTAGPGPAPASPSAPPSAPSSTPAT